MGLMLAGGQSLILIYPISQKLIVCIDDSAAIWTDKTVLPPWTLKPTCRKQSSAAGVQL
jgi:hypothetical protein